MSQVAPASPVTSTTARAREKKIQRTTTKVAGNSNVVANDVAGNGKVVGNNNQLPQTSHVEVNAPNGIAIGGGVVNNPTVINNPPLAQRSLTAQQNTAFIASLQPHCPFEVAVRHSSGNAESQQYADQLSDAIKRAGCTLRRPRFLIDEHEGFGLWVMIHDKDNIPAGADALAGALKAAGIKWQGNVLDAIEPGAVYLMVGLNDGNPTP